MNNRTLLARGRDFQAELNKNSESPDLSESEEQKIIDLTIPQSTNATDLVQFVSQLKKTCHSFLRSTSIMQIGSLGQDTRIIIKINASSFADILDKISGMHGIEKVEEYQPATGAGSRFLKKFTDRKSLTIDPSNRFHVTLKPA